MKRLALLLALFALTAGAQMRGGGHGMGGGIMPMPSVPGSANGPGPMTGGMTAPLVTTNGTIILARTFDIDGDNVIDRELVALSAAGTKSWSKRIAAHTFILGLSHDLVLLVEQTLPADRTRPLTGTLLAIDGATGAQRWQLALNGIPTSAQSFALGTYLTVISTPTDPLPAPTPRLGLGVPEVWAVDNGGVVLWKYDLRQ